MTYDLRPLLVDRPDTASHDIVSNTGTITSPFTGGTQHTELPGARWRISFGWGALDMAEARRMKAIKALCRGGAEVVHIHDLGYAPRRTLEPGVPVVAAPLGEGGGILLPSSGWTPSSLVLDFGDQISYLATDGLYRMHMITAPVLSGADGTALLPILPPIRNPPAVGAALNSVNPSVSVILVGGGQVSSEGVVGAMSLEFEEALYGIL